MHKTSEASPGERIAGRSPREEEPMIAFEARANAIGAIDNATCPLYRGEHP